MTNPTETNPTDTNARAAVPAALLAQLADTGTLAERFSHFQQAFHDEGLLATRLLELCCTRIDALHQQPLNSSLELATAERVAHGDYTELTPTERQALALAEQLAIDAHGVTDTQIAGLAADIGEGATVTLLTAVAMHDANVRMQRVLVPLAEVRGARCAEETGPAER